MKTRNLVDILVRRDDISEDEANELIDDVRYEMHSLISAGDYCGAEDVFTQNLGLEPDYIIDFIV